MSLIEQAEEVFDRAGDVRSSLEAEDQDEALMRIHDLRAAVKNVPLAHTLAGHEEGGSVVQPVHDVGDTLDSLEYDVSGGKFNGQARRGFDRSVEELGKATSYAKGVEEGKP